APAWAHAPTRVGGEFLPTVTTPPASATRNAETDERGRPLLPLPADPTAVGIRLDPTRGPDNNPKTSVTIPADGPGVADLPDGLLSLVPTQLTEYAKNHAGAGTERRGSKVLEWKLSTRELQDLVQFAVFDEEFFTIDNEEVAAEYTFLGKYARAASPETVLCIQTAERRHEVRWPCFGSDPSQTPPVKRLEQPYALALRIRHSF